VNIRDGNALADDLGDIFTVDVTPARFVCARCGHTDVVAALQLFGQTPASVAGCSESKEVVICPVEADGRVFLGTRGIVRLELPMSGS
jgi:hypothetical protein